MERDHRQIADSRRWLHALPAQSPDHRQFPQSSDEEGTSPLTQATLGTRVVIGVAVAIVLGLAVSAAFVPFVWQPATGHASSGGEQAAAGSQDLVGRLEQQLQQLKKHQLLQPDAAAGGATERQLRRPEADERQLSPLIDEVEETLRLLRTTGAQTAKTTTSSENSDVDHTFSLKIYDDSREKSDDAAPCAPAPPCTPQPAPECTPAPAEEAPPQWDCDRCGAECPAKEVPTTSSAPCPTEPPQVVCCACTDGEDQVSKRVGDSRFAYVMMAYDEPGKGEEHLLSVLAMARALQKLSSHPLLLLTNATEFSDGTPVKDTFKLLNVDVRPLYQVKIPGGSHFDFKHWKYAFWKLQIWTLTEYEKLIWLDSDSILYRSVDWLFQEDWMWAQRDDWFCVGKQNAMCSGIMLLFPDEDDFNGLLDYARRNPHLPKGDQQLIWEYFAKERSRAVGFLSDLDASFGRCLGQFASEYTNPDGQQVGGVWNTPAFVHKSGGWKDENDAYSNVCFSHNLHRMRYEVESIGKVVNVCHFHPLGSYYRDLFCEATSRMDLQIREAKILCDDVCWQGLEGSNDGDRCGNHVVPAVSATHQIG